MKIGSGDVQANELDFVELIKFIWQSRRLVFCFIFLGFCLVSGLLIVKDEQYVSKLAIDVGEMPPFSNISRDVWRKNGAFTSFQQVFTNEVVFNKWREENKNTNLKFNSFRNNRFIDDVMVQQDDAAKIVVFEVGKVNQVVIKSRDLDTIIAVKSYADYVDEVVTDSFQNRVIADLEYIRKNFQMGDAVIRAILNLERYLGRLEQGHSTFRISAPSYPKRVSPHPLYVATFGLFFSGMFGVAFVLFLRMLRKEAH